MQGWTHRSRQLFGRNQRQRTGSRSRRKHTVLALRRGNNLDLHGRRSEGGDFLLHAVCDAGVHGSAARHDDVAVEILADVDIALHDGIEGGRVNATRLEAEDGRLEEGLGSTEALVADGDDLAVGKLVRLLQGGGLGGRLDLLLEVKRHVAELLFYVTDDFALGGGVECVAALGKNLHQVVGKIAAGHVDARDGMGEGETLVDGHHVSNTIARVKNDTRGAAGSVQGENSLDGDVEGWGVEGLKDDLRHLLAVGLGIDGSLGQQDGVLLGSHSQLVVEGVVPDLLHVVPVGNNTVLNRIPQRENTALGLCLVSDIGVFLTHSNHYTGGMLALHWQQREKKRKKKKEKEKRRKTCV